MPYISWLACLQDPRRSFRVTPALCFSLAIVLSILYFVTGSRISLIEHRVPNSPSCTPLVLNATRRATSRAQPREGIQPWDSSFYLRGSPKNRFQDNLKKDIFYLTSWANAGFTNQFMSYVNMIYLSTISDRVPIVPPFAPDHHISPSAGPLPFGEIFNITQLRNTLRKPVLEWSQVKILSPRLSLDPPSSVERMGCWSTRPADQREPILAQNLVHHLGVDVSYTRIPAYIRGGSTLAAHAHISLLPLAEKIYPLNPLSHPEDEIIMYPSPSGSKLSTSNHLACFDFLYYASAGSQPFEWKTSWSPAWRLIGRHLPFTDSIVNLAKEYIRRALQVPTTDELPPFIAVHARRGDFVHQCGTSECLAPLSAYLRRVKEIQGTLFVKMGVEVTKVLITSDERDPAFWAEVREIGWKHIDHDTEQTFKRHGEWHVAIIDIVSQSLGVGFVGSAESTVSIVSARRVEEWNHGVTRMVNWGGRD